MRQKFSPHALAVAQALFVTFLWSTSWVLIKVGLADLPALTFAGLRYTLAFVALIPLYWRTAQVTPLRALTRRDWLALTVLGLLYYAVTQGMQFLGLVYLPAITFSLILSTTAVLVAVLGIIFLNERLTWLKWVGTAVFLVGAFIYFYPVYIPAGQAVGFLIGGITLLANSLSSVLGRAVNRQNRLHPVTVTLVSMGIGSLTLLGVGLMVEPWPVISWQNWLLIGFLALVNTALAFTLWNHTLRTLSAIESSIINNTMLIQITLLAWLFLGETLTLLEAVGLIIAALGAVLVQIRRSQPSKI